MEILFLVSKVLIGGEVAMWSGIKERGELSNQAIIYFCTNTGETELTFNTQAKPPVEHS